MSVQAVALEKGSFLGIHTDRGVSDTALRLRSEFEKILSEMLKTIVIGDPRREATNALRQAAEEASSRNWDSYGAAAVDSRSCAQALRLLMALPTTLPMPEITVIPNGRIFFEWYKRPRKTFNISISDNGDLIYAGIFGSNLTHGVEHFADELPDTIARNLSRVFS